MVELGLDREEYVSSRCQDHFLNLKRRRDREVSVHTTQTNRSRSQGGSQISHKENTKSLQREINHLRKKLRRKQRRGTPSSPDHSFSKDSDDSY